MLVVDGHAFVGAGLRVNKPAWVYLVEGFRYCLLRWEFLGSVASSLSLQLLTDSLF